MNSEQLIIFVVIALTLFVLVMILVLIFRDQKEQEGREESTLNYFSNSLFKDLNQTDYQLFKIAPQSGNLTAIFDVINENAVCVGEIKLSAMPTLSPSTLSFGEITLQVGGVQRGKRFNRAEFYKALHGDSQAELECINNIEGYFLNRRPRLTHEEKIYTINFARLSNFSPTNIYNEHKQLVARFFAIGVGSFHVLAVHKDTPDLLKIIFAHLASKY